MANRKPIMLAALLLVGLVANFGRASDDDTANDLGPRYGEPQPVFYEIGMRINSTGESTGLTGTVPIPIDWPEQKISIVREHTSENLRKISYRNLTRDVRQMLLKGNRIGPGESALGTVIVRADRRMIERPTAPEKLIFAKKIPGPVRQFLKPSPYIESNDPKIRQVAESIVPDPNATAFDQVEQIYRWVRENVEYKFDTQIHGCLEALESRIGDCEELSSLFIAVCRAKDIPARAVWIPSHTYPEFYLADENGNGYWLPCQVAGSYEFGAMSELKPILQKGDRFKVPGNPKPLRYVQPTLIASDSSGGLSIEFIARQINDEVEIRQLLQLTGDEITGQRD